MGKATLFVRDLEVLCILGCLESERKNLQKIAVDVELDYDISQPAESDDISTAVDYRDIAQGMIQLIQQKEYQLIEKLAHECCELVLKQWPKVDRVKFSVRKFKVLPTAFCTGITLEQFRKK